MKRKDVILIAVILIAAIAMYLWISYNRSRDGGTVRITVDSEIYGEYSLSTDRTIEIETEAGTNILIIENGYVYMTDADCPDKYCINQGKISKNTETIVCLPHKVVAEIISDVESEVDMIVS